MSKGEKILLAIIIVCGILAALIWFLIGKMVEILAMGNLHSFCFGLSVFAIVLVVACCLSSRR